MQQDKFKKAMAMQLHKLAAVGPYGLAGQLVTVMDKEGEDETEMLVELVDQSNFQLHLFDLNNSEMTTRSAWSVIKYKNLSSMLVV